MIERRPWGWFETLARGEGWLFKRLVVEPGKRLSLQYHEHRAEQWLVVRGRGTAQIGERRLVMETGHTLTIPLGATHRIDNVYGTERLEVLEIQLGARLDEHDIVRLVDDYGRVATVTAGR